MSKPARDWKTGKGYPRHFLPHLPPIAANARGELVELAPAQWAWEFLRRNPRYREHMAAVVAYAEEQRHRGVTDVVLPPEFETSERWGAIGCGDPEDDSAVPGFRQPTELIDFGVSMDEPPPDEIYSFAGHIQKWRRPELPRLPPFKIAVTVDLSLAIGPQFDRLKVRLQREQRELGLPAASTRVHLRLLPLYLRLLDAALEGEGPASIVNNYPDEFGFDTGTVADQLAAARARTEPAGYLGLLRVMTQPGPKTEK